MTIEKEVMSIEELQAAVLIALAACPDVRYRLISETSIAFTFQSEKGVQLFVNGIAFYPRLRPVVAGVEVVVIYID